MVSPKCLPLRFLSFPNLSAFDLKENPVKWLFFLTCPDFSVSTASDSKSGAVHSPWGFVGATGATGHEHTLKLATSVPPEAVVKVPQSTVRLEAIHGIETELVEQHNPQFAKKTGVPFHRSVGRNFIHLPNHRENSVWRVG